MSDLKGSVFSGMGVGSDYIGMEEYTQRIESVTGFKPFPGTLNLHVEPEDVADLLKKLENHRIEGFEVDDQPFSGLDVYMVEVNGVNAAFIDIDVTDYDDSVMEIVAPDYLRDKLDLEDGDEVTVTY